MPKQPSTPGEDPTTGPPPGKVTPISDHSWITGRRRLASPAARRVHALIEHPESVAQLAPLALHRLTSELGLADSMPLLELADSEQVHSLVDLDVWKQDRVDLANLLDWGAALAQLEPENTAAHLWKLDDELLGLLLRRQMRIYLARGDENAIPEEPEGTFYSTPDGALLLDLLGESEGQNDKIVQIVEALYRDDPDTTRRFLSNLMWELPTELEEASLRWRSARLEDLGFSDPTEALRVYAYLDPATVSADEMTADKPLVADPEPTSAGELTELLPAGDSFWGRAIGRIDDDRERERLAAALTALANLTLSADRVDPADREHGALTLAQLRGRLSLGLEHLSDGDEARAVGILRQVALMRIARLGHSLVLERQRRLLPWLRAGRLGRRPRGLDLLDSPLRERLQSMMAQPPQLMEDDGRTRPFAARADLAAIDVLVETAVASAELTPKSSWPSPLPATVHLSSFFCTQLLNRVLGRTGPLDREAVVAAMSSLEGDRLAAVKTKAVPLAQDNLGRAPAPHERELCLSWIDGLAQSLARLDPESFDLRYLECLVTTDD